MESNRRLDVDTIMEAAKRLDELVLWVLRSRGKLGRSSIIQEIFVTHGFSPPPEKIDEILEWMEREGYVRREKEGLISVYALTEKGQEIANGKNEHINLLRAE